MWKAENYFMQQINEFTQCKPSGVVIEHNSHVLHRSRTATESFHYNLLPITVNKEQS